MPVNGGGGGRQRLQRRDAENAENGKGARHGVARPRGESWEKA